MTIVEATSVEATSAWTGAITLSERTALAHPPAQPADPEVARKRFERWRQQAPFDHDGGDGLFARRLAMDGLDETALLALLGEAPAALAGRAGDLPEWQRELDEAFAGADPGYQLPFAGRTQASVEARFLWLAAPLIERAERRIAAAATALADAGRARAFEPASVARVLMASLPEQLLWTLSRVCVLELNVARLEERIAGETPEARFDAFIARLRRPEVAREILERYPVLARQLVLRLRFWADAAVELLERLAADWDDIRAAFGAPADPGLLIEARAGAGDRHRGNRSVTLLRFASGWRLVYKPRPQAIAVHFQEMLEWMNARGFAPAFRLLGVLDRGAYGWMEFVDAAPCATAEEVGAFYGRMGGLLALLYALDAGDFHHENLIAAGEHPMLVDLESIVEPRPPMALQPGASALAETQLASSVLRIGLLPHKALVGGGEGIDISALGMAPGQLSDGAIPHWQGRGTDEMHLDRRPMEMIASEHRPSLDGTLTDVSDYVDDLAGGFARAYRLIAGDREGLEAILERMAGDEARVILRATRTYGHLLQESFHPFLLREALERDRHFDHLWLSVLESPPLELVVQAEREELLAADVPLFSARLGSRDLLGAGGRVWPGFLERSGLEMVRDRLARLSEADAEQQLWFVRAAVATHQINVFGLEESLEGEAQVVEAQDTDTEQLVAAASRIGDRLAELALSAGGDEATWIGVQSRQGRNFSLTPLGHDLYAGLPGVVLFLARLAEVTGHERYDTLARAGFATLRGQEEVARELVTSVGGFEGWGGTIWALTHLARIWDDEAILRQAHDLVPLVPALVAEDRTFDVMAGAAGCIPALLALQRTDPRDATLDAAVACGEHLLAHVQPMAHGASWMPAEIQSFAAGPLTGFGHGAAGCAWALLELFGATGDERFRAAALDALAYERSLFEPELETWKEMRTLDVTNVALEQGTDLYLIAWCHGAPGVGLSRLRARRHLEDPEMAREIEIALGATKRKGFGRSHCLCHGDLGNAELFVEAGGPWLAEARRAGARVLAEVAERGWKSGLPRNVEVPGLMTGLAGMGYGLLRLAMPERVPSVLLLDPPIE